MRFEVTQVLDVIERHLTTEPALAQAVVDLGHVAWYGALDGGRPVSLLRAGLLIDALSRHLGEDAVMIYAIASRELLTDADLTSKERMVLGRWSGDGMIEVVPVMADRVPEVADITGLPVVTIDGFPGLERRYPWLRGVPERVFHLVPGEGGARIVGGHPIPGATEGRAPLLGRLWRCVRRDCPLFGERRGFGQAVPRMKSGVPVCPRHDEQLTNAGPRPPSVTMVLVVDGTVRDRFVVRAGRPVVVGRSPDDATGVVIGGFLDGAAAQMVSRNHVRLDLREDGLYAADLSTNGTVLHRAGGAPAFSSYGLGELVPLKGGDPQLLAPADWLELHTGVVLARAGHLPGGPLGGQGTVMGDAPTMTMRPQL